MKEYNEFKEFNDLNDSLFSLYSLTSLISRRPTVIGIAAGLISFTLMVLIWPLPSAVRHPEDRPSVRVLDREGRVLYVARDPEAGLREHLTLGEATSGFVQALIATEDRGFYDHHGVSLRGTLRALWQNLVAREVVEGGSTLTQQLVRNLLHPERRNFPYKLREAALAVKLDMRWSKDRILETYLNTAYFGHQAYGLAAATHTFLGKEPSELSMAENAFLVGLLQSPSALDPFVRFEAAKERQKAVLQNLVETGRIGQSEADELFAQEIRLTTDRVPIEAPHFTMWVLEQVTGDMGHGTADIRTTLDLDLQKAAERAVERQMEALKDRNVTSAAVVVLDAKNGDILAMVGSADYFDAEHDGAVNVALSARQPGSTLKPFTYALALARGDTAATTVSDVEAQFLTEEGNPYVPRNYDFGEHGLVRYREALANSYNIAAVRVLERVGVGDLLAFLRDAGLTTLTETPEHYGLALTLGAGEVRLLDLAEAFGIFARGGRTLTARTDPGQAVVPGRNILDARVAWLIADILSDERARVPEFGEDNPLNFDVPVAAKTGTTRNSRDNWVVGFTPDRIVGVWVGNADNTPMQGTSGITGAGPLFHDVMVEALRGLPSAEFPRPSGIQNLVVCRLSGKLPTPDCPEIIEEKFIDGTQPKESDDIYRRLRIDTRNGLLAGPNCPANVVAERVFAVFPPDLRDWARQNGYAQAPTGSSPLCGSSELTTGSPRESISIAITHPRAGDSFRLDPMIPDVSEKILFTARSTGDIQTVTWLVDGAVVGTGKAPDFEFRWTPSEGTHAIEARAGELTERVRVEVVR